MMLFIIYIYNKQIKIYITSLTWEQRQTYTLCINKGSFYGTPAN